MGHLPGKAGPTSACGQSSEGIPEAGSRATRTQWPGGRGGAAQSHFPGQTDGALLPPAFPGAGSHPETRGLQWGQGGQLLWFPICFSGLESRANSSRNTAERGPRPRGGHQAAAPEGQQRERQQQPHKTPMRNTGRVHTWTPDAQRLRGQHGLNTRREGMAGHSVVHPRWNVIP